MHFACVITVDIKGSKKLKDRAVIQNEILNLLSNLNKKFSDHIIADFMITLGDEFQGVLKNTKPILKIFKYIKENLPVEFYCGVGVGSIETPLSRKPSEMDGSAFHRSREALEEAKKKRIEIVFKSDHEEIDFPLNSIMELILYVQNKWTKRQREVISFLESQKDVNLSVVAKHFRVSKQAISKIIRAAGWKAIRKAEKVVEHYLELLEQSKPHMVNPLKTTIRG